MKQVEINNQDNHKNQMNQGSDKEGISEWRETELSKVGDVVSGGTPSTSVPEFWDGEILFVTPFDLSRINTAYIENTERKISQQGLANSSATLLPIDSIVISSRAPIGYVAIAKKELTTNQGCKSLVLNENFDSKFIYYSLLQNIERLKKVSGGTTFTEISKGDLEKVKLPHPTDKSIQRKIACILSTADAVIEKTRAAIAKYKAIKQGMLHDLFTRGLRSEKVKVKSEKGEWIEKEVWNLRPRYEDAPDLYKPARPSGGESKLGWIPREWDEKELSNYLVFISYGFTNPMPETQDGPYLVTAANVNGGRIQYETARKTSVYAFDNLLTDKSRPKVNDILLTKDGTLGRIAIVEKENLCINQSVAILRPNKLVNPIFLKILLESPTYQKLMLDDSRGSAIKHIYITDVDKMKVAFPSIDEQEKIAERLTSVDNKLQTEQVYLQKMQSIKKGLMEDLLSGEVKVKSEKFEELESEKVKVKN